MAPPLWQISERQSELMEACRTKQFVLASGPRLTGKTKAALDCIVDHGRRTDRAIVSIIAISQSTGLDAGVWRALTVNTIPNWINAGLLKWHKQPYTANVSKRPTCSIVNNFGTVSEFQLDSLKYEHEVEERFKSREFTCIYVPELSNFHEEKTFNIWSECLRALHLTDDQFLFLADTNPADDGEESWIYQKWFVMPRMTYPEYCEHCHKKDLPVSSEAAFESYKKSLALVQFTIDDNPFLTQERIDRLIRTYDGDPDLYDRYILGLWKKASRDALFAKVFRPIRHVVGEIETPANPEPEMMAPEAVRRPDMPVTLITGWDPGSGTNSSFHIIEKTMTIRMNSEGKPVERSLFKVLDELAIIDQDHSLEEFVAAAVRKMEFWQTLVGRDVNWVHWSDRSVFDMKEPRHLKYYHQIIYEASDGLVVLRAADRGPNTVRQRVSLMRKLLFEDRLLFSNTLAPKAIEMCRSMRPGTSELMPIQKGSKHKHVFDSIMYAIASEAFDEIEELVFNRPMTMNTNPQATSLVTVGI